MHRDPVVSISIASVGYDPELRLLEVEYKNGIIRQYPGVPATDAEDVMTLSAFAKQFTRKSRPSFPSEAKSQDRR